VTGIVLITALGAGRAGPRNLVNRQRYLGILACMKRLIPLFALLLAYRVSHADPQLVSETRNVPEFRAIELAGVLDVEVTVGKPASVVVSGEAELLDKIVTTVENGTLVLDTKHDRHRRISNSHLRARITVPDLTSVALSGTGSLTVNGVANTSLAIDLSGTGSLAIAGSTDALRVKLDGTGDVRAKNLMAKDATIALAGTGSASLYASQSLDAQLTGTGSIDVHGHPARVKKSRSGLGSIHIR
jgi:hypothetical protein